MGTRSMRRRGRAGVAATLVAATTLAMIASACGGGSSSNGEETKSATQVLADAKSATQHASSFHIAGTVTDTGGSTSLDLNLSKARGGGSVTEKGAKLDVVATPSTVYVRADKSSWQKLTGSSAAAELFADRWVKSPASSSDFSSFASILNPSKLLTGLTPEGTLSKKSVTKVDGKKVVPLVDSKGGTLYVAATGPAYILKVVNSGGSSNGGKGSVTFDQYGSAKVPSVPSGAVDLSKLQGQ